MRVSQQMLFSNFITRMNQNLSDLVESNLQASSQKRINRPSDDPVGTSRVMDLRTSLSGIKSFKKNIDTAKGWLGLADETLLQASNILTRAKELAEQAATGTLTKENRLQISYEARQLFKQMVSLSNTTYDNKSIFAGHKVDQNAFEERLWLTDSDGALDNASWTVQGSSETSIVVQFFDSANASGGTATNFLSGTVGYRYSTDGGSTFTSVSGPIASSGGNAVLSLGGVQVQIAQGTTIQTTSTSNTNDTRGTWLWVRPTAQYKGDDEDGTDVDIFGAQTVQGTAAGTFSGNVAVRIDSGAGSMLGPILYSYSLDGGVSWVSGNLTGTSSTSNAAQFIVPGGILTLSSNGSNALASGTQFIVRPRMADISLRISSSEDVTVNSIGKDIFGGVYADPASNGTARVVFGSSPEKNMFDVLGNLVAFMETNNQSGIQRCLAALDKSQSQLMNQTANVAGRENRLQVASSILSGLELNEKERLANVEDIDVGELMTKLAQQQISYEAVLKTSSLIMKMTLVNYV